jgi:hypothetical protein
MIDPFMDDRFCVHERTGEEIAVTYFMAVSWNIPAGTEETTNPLHSQISRCPGRDSNLARPEYKPGRNVTARVNVFRHNELRVAIIP